MRSFFRASLLLLLLPSRTFGQWAPDGILLSNGSSSSEAVFAIPTASAGAILVWATFDRFYSDESWNIYAQKLDGGGYAQWTPGGVPVCVAPRSQAFPHIASDGAGGVLITGTIHVFDVSGKRVVRSRSESLAAGSRELRFDGRDHKGNLLPSGVYFFRVSANGESTTRKVVIAR